MLSVVECPDRCLCYFPQKERGKTRRQRARGVRTHGSREHGVPHPRDHQLNSTALQNVVCGRETDHHNILNLQKNYKESQGVSTVSFTVKRHSETNSNRKRSGRPKTESEDKFLNRLHAFGLWQLYWLHNYHLKPIKLNSSVFSFIHTSANNCFLSVCLDGIYMMPMTTLDT